MSTVPSSASARWVLVGTAHDSTTEQASCHLIKLSVNECGASTGAWRDGGESAAVGDQGRVVPVLAHPGRVRVLEILRDGDRTVAELVPLVGLEASHLSQQLALLRRARLVTSRREGSTVTSRDSGRRGRGAVGRCPPRPDQDLEREPGAARRPAGRRPVSARPRRTAIVGEERAGDGVGSLLAVLRPVSEGLLVGHHLPGADI